MVVSIEAGRATSGQVIPLRLFVSYWQSKVESKGIHTISTIGGVPMVLRYMYVSGWFFGGLFSVADCFVEIELFV